MKGNSHSGSYFRVVSITSVGYDNTVLAKNILHVTDNNGSSSKQQRPRYPGFKTRQDTTVLVSGGTFVHCGRVDLVLSRRY